MYIECVLLLCFQSVSAVSLLSVPPVIFVVIGLTTVLDEYVVYARNETGGILTDSAGNDIISL